MTRLPLLLALGACAPAEPADPPVVTTFAMNVHDWGMAEESAAAVERALDLHEAYEVPVDVFLTDAVARRFEADSPQLVERLRASPVVAVSYHVRPPHPYATDFDWLGLSALDADARYAVLARYEEAAVDLATGEPTPAPGGYAHLATLIGEPPFAAGPAVSPTLSRVYAELGATFAIDHDEAHDLGDVDDGLYVRPEHLDLKLYEWRTEDACEILAEEAADAATPASGPRFLNVKWHENNLYADSLSWMHVYFEGGDAAAPMLPRPWDVDAWEGAVPLLSENEQAARWALYEGAVACVAADRARWCPANLRDVAGML